MSLAPDKLNFSHFFDKKTISRGTDYMKQGRVHQLSTKTAHDKVIIHSTVRGSRSQAYQTNLAIDIKTHALVSHCSCPMMQNCKHVVATLLASKNRIQQLSTPTPKHLDNNLTRWLNNTAKQLKAKPEKQEEARIETLAFVIDTQPHSAISMQPGWIKKLKNGSWSALKKFNTDRYYYKSSGKLTQEEQIFIETLKVLTAEDYYSDKLYFKEEDAHQALSILLESPYLCFWQTSKSEALSLGTEKDLSLNWIMDASGTQQLTLTTQSHDIVLPCTPLWYIDVTKHQAGILHSDLPNTLLTQIKNMPSIKPMQAENFHQALQKVLPKNVTLPAPNLFDEIKTIDSGPQPYLEILTRKVETKRGFASKSEKRSAVIARCMMRYEKQNINPAAEQKIEFTIKEGNALYYYKRDIEKEIKHYKKLERLKLTFVDHTDEINDAIQYNHEFEYSFFLGFQDEFDKIAKFQKNTKPKIEALGWLIEYADNTPIYDFIEPDAWYTELDDSSEHDWFNMQMGIIVDNQPIDLLPILIESIKNAKPITTEGDETILRLPNNKSIKIPHKRMQKILTILSHLVDTKKTLSPNEPIKVERRKLALLKEIEKAFHKTQMRWLGDKKLLELSEKLNNFKKIKKVSPDKNFKATLRPYQQDGVNWLQFLREHTLNGILADDMGLGKTVQVLAHISIEKHKQRTQKPSLIVAPTSVLVNWKHEIEHFTPHLSTLVLYGPERGFKFDDISQHDLVLTTYALVTRDKEHLIKHDYYYIILDESHYIKNKQAKKTQILQQINATHRLCLTGTPLENHLGELWSQFNFLMPGLLNNAAQFKKQYQTPIEKHKDKNKQLLLNQLTKPFLLRRTKQTVVQDLPEKSTIVKYVEMEKEQRDLYESIRLAMDRKVRKAIDEKGIERSQIIILDALLKLRQACCDPRLLSLKEAQSIQESAKLDLLMQMLPEMIEENRKILLFSQFTSMLSLIEERVKELNIKYVKLTGNTVNREKCINAFQHGDTPLFLISLKAGGVGLNLTAADTVIHYDPWWNPAVEQQATDRAHRIGQKQAVFVYKLITTNTIEEKIMTMQDQKQALANALFDKNSNTGKLNKADLQKLFLPA